MKRALKWRHSPLIALLLAVASCGQHKERRAINTLKDGLTNSNQTIISMIGLANHAVDERLNDPLIHDKVIIWAPKIKKLQTAFNNCIADIDSLSSGQIKEPDAFADNLSVYHKTLQSINTGIPLNTVTAGEITDFIGDALSGKALLSRIKNDVLIAQYDMVKYCLDQLSLKGWAIDYDPQLMISGSRIRRGDTVYIKGWYGMTISGLDMTLTARGATIPQTTGKLIEYKFVANDPPGSYYLPVQIH